MNCRTVTMLAVAALVGGCTQKPAAVAHAQVELKPVVEARLQPDLQPPPPVVVRTPRTDSPRTDTNGTLAERVRRALEDESHIHAAAIDVTAVGGTVTLWGTAASDDERTRATRVAARIAGVKWVDNKLVISAGS